MCILMWRSRALLCIVCGPGKPPQVARFFLLWSWKNLSHFLWKEYFIAIDSFGRSEVHSQNYIV